MAACGMMEGVDMEDECVRVVRNMKTVTVPCTRNTFKQYTVKVPRQVTEQVPRTVKYTDYESRSKQVPYTVMNPEKRIRMEMQSYQVPVTKYFTKVVMEDRKKQVPVPYYVNVPETKYRTVTEQVPVQKTKTEMQPVTKTVFDTQTRTRCVPQTKIVTKQIPVYSVVPRPPQVCPTGVCPPQEPSIQVGPLPAPPMEVYPTKPTTLEKNIADFNAADTNNDGVLSFNEFAQARANGDYTEITNPNITTVNC